jgi:ATP-binding cassette subfamily B multidrug efflux pump
MLELAPGNCRAAQRKHTRAIEGELTQRFLKAIVPYLKQVAGLLVVGSVGGLVMNTAVVLPALLLGRLIDTAMAWGEGNGTSHNVLTAGAAYVGAMALYQGARLVKRWGLRMGNQRIAASVRADALRGVLNWPMERLNQVPIGDLMARIIGDVDVMMRGVSELTTETWDTVLFSISLIAGMLIINPALTLLALLPVPLGMALAKATGGWVGERTITMREASAALTAYLQERLAGLRVIRLFGRIDATVDRAALLSQRLAEANLDTIRLRSGLQPVYTVLMTSGIVIVLWLGGNAVVAGEMTLGLFIAYFDLYLRFVGRGHRVPQLFNSVQSGAAAYARLVPLLAPTLPGRGSWRSTLWPHAVPGDDRPTGPRPDRPPHPCAVSARNITFSYPGSNGEVLKGLSLEIPPAALVAVTGPVGSGKSALARVLLGLYPLQTGHISLDGQPLAALTPAERAARIGYLPQAPFLFSGTVRDNILLDLSAGAGAETRDQVAHWIQVAGLEEDVHRFPDGPHTQIGEQGVRVSGGQRQRIALARALAVRPGLLVLDDPFSAVDADTEARIISALRESFGPAAATENQATIIFFSHRLAAFPLADAVVVLDGGHIVEQGTHAALLKADGLYSRIYRAQQRVGRRDVAPEAAQWRP